MDAWLFYHRRPAGHVFSARRSAGIAVAGPRSSATGPWEVHRKKRPWKITLNMDHCCYFHDISKWFSISMIPYIYILWLLRLNFALAYHATVLSMSVFHSRLVSLKPFLVEQQVVGQMGMGQNYVSSKDQIWLVVYLPPLKNHWVRQLGWNDIPNCFWKVIKFHGSKAPTRNELVNGELKLIPCFRYQK